MFMGPSLNKYHFLCRKVGGRLQVGKLQFPICAANDGRTILRRRNYKTSLKNNPLDILTAFKQIG